MAAGQGPVPELQLAELTKRLETLEAETKLPVVQGVETPPVLPAVLPSGSSALTEIDKRITGAETPSEAREWLLIRSEYQQQNEDAEERKHVRSMEKMSGFAKVGVSIVAIGAGSGLALAGLVAPGLFCLGAGLYGIAPDYVNKTVTRFIGGGNRNA